MDVLQVKLNSNVTAYIEVYNEEERIEVCLKSFSWVDELYVFDKHSTDKTRDIAAKYATEVILVPYCEGSENVISNIKSRGTCDWCIFPTASSLIDPSLANRIIEYTTNNQFDYDVIGLPYKMYSFGISSKYSPYYNSHKRTLIRRCSLSLSTKLHSEIGYSSNKVFDLPIQGDAFFYHCTHKDAKTFLLQSLRYTEYEAKTDLTETREKAFFKLIKSIGNVVVKRKSFILGWDGIGVATAYVTYFAMRFLLIWDRDRRKGSEVYTEVRLKIENLINDMADK